MVLPMVIVALEPIKLSKAPPMGMKRVYIHEPIAGDSQAIYTRPMRDNENSQEAKDNETI